MVRRARREWTMEEYEAWQAADARMEMTHSVADEEGGPSITMAPVPEKGESVDAFDPVELPAPVLDSAGRHLAPVPFDPVPSRKSSRVLGGARGENPQVRIRMVYSRADHPAALPSANRMIPIARANTTTPITPSRVSRSSRSRGETCFTGGGGSRRIRETRTGPVARSTDCFPVRSGAAMAPVTTAARLSSG